jgi:hypothetical protein
MIVRYLRAFVQALDMTLRGEKPPEAAISSESMRLRQWIAELSECVSFVRSAVAQQQLDMTRIVLRVDKRDMNMKTLVDLLDYRAGTEYPDLLAHAGQSGLTVIYTSNHNDQYYVRRLLEVLEASQAALPVKLAVEAVQRHLASLPVSLNDV